MMTPRAFRLFLETAASEPRLPLVHSITMRRTLIAVAAMLGCTVSWGAAEASRRYVSLDRDALVTARAVAARHGAPLEIFETEGDVALIAFETDDLDALSEQMHERHHRCGGFVLHESIDDARAALHVPAFRSLAIDYTLDRPDAVHAVLPTLDRGKIVGVIRELSAMQNRYYQSPSGAAASIWLRDRWRSFTNRSDVTVELVDHGYAQQSVIMTIPGTTRASEVVVIGGHLDSIARGGVSSTAPGADDDASGIATLTEVARALLASDFRPTRTVQFMAYAAEEVGLRGSQAIVRDYRQRGVDVVGVIQLDMTNYRGSDKDIWLMKDFTNAAQNAFVIRLIDAYVGATWGLTACGYACSDHASWYRAGIPASMPFESRMNEYNRSIHTDTDTLETSGNNADHAIKFARLAAAYAIELGKPESGPAPAASSDRQPFAIIAFAAWLLIGAGVLQRES